ncbi:MAG: zinc-dependent metalloprotease, partial [Thermoanaerobaculia bacterium]|nr:zinc-dependent metalloprotease [Thermoanaerobaculia bacterium]
GHVTLGSLRVRQDRLIFEALGGVAESGSGAPDDPVELALARIRQLSAHEVGHTLGLAHNFAASTYGRASVMDYPAPLVTIGDGGALDFAAAYDVGVGAWDVHAVRYAYSQFPAGTDEEQALEHLVREAERGGLRFVTDADARPAGAAHPWGNLWDNGSDPVAELARLVEVRRLAMSRFGVANLGTDRPVALLHETFVPLYFLHRFQILAAAKVLGGLDYRYAVQGDSDVAARRLDPAWQRRALAGLLDLVEPAELEIDEAILELLLPRPFGYGPNRELVASEAAPAFDAVGAAATLADMVLEQVLQPERLVRVVDHHRRDETQPSLGEVLGEVTRRVFEDSRAAGRRQQEIERVVQSVTLDRMLSLARSTAVPVQVQCRLEAELHNLDRLLSGAEPPLEPAYAAHLRGRIARFLDRSEVGADSVAAAAEPPPGQPIGLAPWLHSIESGCSQAEGRR